MQQIIRDSRPFTLHIRIDIERAILGQRGEPAGDGRSMGLAQHGPRAIHTQGVIFKQQIEGELLQWLPLGIKGETAIP